MAARILSARHLWYRAFPLSQRPLVLPFYGHNCFSCKPITALTVYILFLLIFILENMVSNEPYWMYPTGFGFINLNVGFWMNLTMLLHILFLIIEKFSIVINMLQILNN